MAAQPLPERLDLEDPRALRAVAHEIRMWLITELYGGAVLTATEAAARAGITPSAMSYHLRALAKWGIVVPDDSADGRERPWRAAARALNLQPAVDAGGSSAASLVVNTLVADVQRLLVDLLSDNGRARGNAGMTRSVLRLTDEQAAALHAETEALIDRYDRLSAQNGAAVRRWNLAWFTLPDRHPDDAAPS